MATYDLTVGMPTFMKEFWASSSSISVSSYMTATYDGNCVTLTNNQSSNGEAWINNTPFPSTVSGNTSDTAQILYICAEAKGYSTNTVGHPRIWYRTYVNGSTTLTNYAMNTLDGKMDAPNDDKWYTFSARVATYNNGNYYEYTGVSPVLYTSNGVGDKASFRNFRVYNLTELYGRGKEPTKTWCDKNLTGAGKIINLMAPRSSGVTNSDVSISKGIFTYAAGKTAMTQGSTKTPIYGHKYYGRCYQKAPANYTYGDARFEYYAEDTAGTGLMTFGVMKPTNNEWEMMSSIQELTGEPTGTTWTYRSFTVNGNTDAYRKEMMLIDLTEAFGPGNEPTKEWCDRNIPFFESELALIPELKEGDVINCPYSGTSKGILLPIGVYNLEAWGASGGTYNSTYAAGGMGAYATGWYKAKKPSGLILYAGGQGSVYATTTNTSQGGGGFNGGGGAGYRGGGGGGASDIRIGYNSLYSRVLVAGGGGGAYAYSSTYKAAGGAGGGEKASAGSYYNSSYSAWVGGAGTLSAGGTGGTGSSANYNGKAGTFGQGGNTGYKYNSSSYYSAGAGGGGWYGGGGGGNYSSNSRTRAVGGGGGSGYVYTKALSRYCPSEWILGEDELLESGTTSNGARGFVDYGGSYVTGHSGNGACRITIERLGNTDDNVKIGSNTEKTLWIGDNLIDKAFLGNEPIFPAIEFVDYIEACGHQYIDTGIVPTLDTSFEISVDIKAQTVQTDTCLLGSRTGSEDQFVLWDGYNTNPVSHRTVPAIGTLSSNYYYAPSSTKNIFKYDGNYFICNNENIFTLKNTAGQNNKNIFLFALNNNGTADSRMYQGKMYYLKIWQAGQLVRDFKPAKTKDGVYGLYDMIKHEFLPCTNRGNFYTENLLANITMVAGDIYASGQTTPGADYSSTSRVRCKEYIEIEPSAHYVFRRNNGWTSGKAVGLRWYTSNKTYIGNSAIGDFDENIAYLNAPSNAKYFRFIDEHNSTTATYTMYKLQS
ncbi:MAG: hypothetical protein J6B87_06255 [Clostridia bacterium]|nr:hypothetical protein [Clostridia bacterium]